MDIRERCLAEDGKNVGQRRGEDDRVRVFKRRFATATRRLGHAETAVRLAGVYALAGLADDWPDGRQTCIDELCAYLQNPYEPPPEADPPAAEQLTFGGSHEVHHTVISIITAHLRDNARVSWRGHDFNFTGVRFDGGDFSGAEFSGGTVDFRDAVFAGGTLDFSGAVFSGATVDFTGAVFSGATVDFTGAALSGGTVHFTGAALSGGVIDFSGAEFSGTTAHFNDAAFSGGTLDFTDATLSGGTLHFTDAEFSGTTVDFTGAEFSDGTVDFSDATFSGRRGGLGKDVATDPPAGLLLPPA
jgi:uncharacterized protein YjbI with pentapeptide repeats